MLKRTEPITEPSECGLGLMETIIGILVGIIVLVVFAHLAKTGYETYKLKGTSGEVAHELTRARELAMLKNKKVSVIFTARDNRYGLDRNDDGKLDGIESDELPEGMSLSEDCTVTFLPDGSLASKSSQPRISISNARNTRNISVSSIGTVSVE